MSLAFTVIVKNDLTWQLYVGSDLIDATKVDCLASFPSIVSFDVINAIFEVLERHKICPGNPDEGYVSMLQDNYKKGAMKTCKGNSISSYVDKRASVVESYCCYSSTVRASGCDLLIPMGSKKCAKCIKCRNTLRASYKNYLKHTNVIDSVTHPSSHANLRFMSTPQRSSRIAKARAVSTAREHRVKGLEKKIAKSINNGVTIDGHLEADLIAVINHTLSGKSSEILPEGSFKRLFLTAVEGGNGKK